MLLAVRKERRSMFGAVFKAETFKLKIDFDDIFTTYFNGNNTQLTLFFTMKIITFPRTGQLHKATVARRSSTMNTLKTHNLLNAPLSAYVTVAGSERCFLCLAENNGICTLFFKRTQVLS